MKPCILGITGGIGSGKSVVAHLLRTMDVAVYDSDSCAKMIMNKDSMIRQQLIEWVGEDVYDSRGLNRPCLASWMFASADHTAAANGLIHPRVRVDFEQWVVKHSDCLLLGLESAILFESGFDNLTDAVLAVTAPQEVRMRRIVQRDQSTEARVQIRMNAQITDEERISNSRFHLVNDGLQPLIPHVVAILNDLLS
jgi:dephospho-CoA kinase